MDIDVACNLHTREKSLSSTVLVFYISRGLQEKFAPLGTRVLFVSPVLSDYVTFVVDPV